MPEAASDLISPAENKITDRQSKRRFLISRDGDTLVFKRSHVYALLLPLTFVLGLSVGYLSWGRSTPSQRAAAVPQTSQTQAEQQQNVQRFDVPEDGDPSIGRKDAAITIIEFSDFECPFCRRWYNDVYLRLKQDYPDQVRIVFRDFPLISLHPNALPAAEAANCANEQGGFWEFHDKLFSSEELGEAVYLEYAGDMGLNVDEFKACLDSGRQKSEVMGDYEYASGLGVRSTPTFFLNGLPIVGAQPYDEFKQVIEQELAGEIP